MVLAIIQGVVLVPLYLKYIGAVQYGQWLALGSIVAMLSLIDLGVTSLVVQKSALFHGRDDKKSLKELISTIIVFDLLVSVFILVAGIGLSFWLPHWIGAAGEQSHTLRLAFQFATVDVMLMLLVSMSGSILFGIQKPEAHLAGVFIGTAASIGVTVVLLFQHWGILAIACGSLVRPLVALPINIGAIKKNLHHLIFGSMLKLNPAMTKSFFAAALWLGPSKLAETMTSQVDNIIVVKILQPIDVTMLNLTRKASEIAVQVVGRLSVSFMSGLSHLRGSDEEEKIRSIVSNLFLVSGYMACCILCSVLILNEDFVGLWTSSSMYAGAGVTILACIYCLLKILRITTYNVVFSHGDVRITSISSLIESALQAVLGIVFCKVWGISGVVIASIIAVICGGIVQLVALLKTHKYSIISVMKGAFKITVISTIVLIAGKFVHYRFMPNSWLGFILFGVGITIQYVILVAVTERRFRQIIINHIM
ncbi:MAG: polysaccharide biosynthesis C-terminal domain-containing protein [Desulfuromonadaceae bacterium]|nr:polysaccharide biosynthesis C-terminal domain-containing protein [Desulfuromonadaceae bacterium]